jgi:hypothetical protein
MARTEEPAQHIGLLGDNFRWTMFCIFSIGFADSFNCCRRRRYTHKHNKGPPIDGSRTSTLEAFTNTGKIVREFRPSEMLKYGNHRGWRNRFDDSIDIRVKNVLLRKATFRLKPIVRVKEQNLVGIAINAGSRTERSKLQRRRTSCRAGKISGGVPPSVP